MIRGIDAILLSSQSAKNLAEFYRDKVGLKQTEEAEMGEGKSKTDLFSFEFKKTSSLYIMDHSKVKGKNVNPERYLINFEVDDIKKEAARLKKAKVKVVQDTYHIEGYGWVATFEDLDGNYFQLVQVRPS